MAYDRFDGKNDLHQVISGGGIEIGHFAYVIVPDHTAETGVMRVIDPNDATGRGLPEDGSARLGTQFATWTADFLRYRAPVSKMEYTRV